MAQKLSYVCITLVLPKRADSPNCRFNVRLFTNQTLLRPNRDCIKATVCPIKSKVDLMHFEIRNDKLPKDKH